MVVQFHIVGLLIFRITLPRNQADCLLLLLCPMVKVKVERFVIREVHVEANCFNSRFDCFFVSYTVIK